MSDGQRVDEPILQARPEGIGGWLLVYVILCCVPVLNSFLTFGG